MEMHQIRYFLAVASNLNFTRAAERCNVSPPSLLRAIKLLEAEFGGQLFKRERNRTHLTELGKIALPHLEQIINSSEKVKSETTRAAASASVAFNLGIMCTIAPVEFLDLFEEFKSRWPNVVLTIEDNNSKMLQQALLAGNLDAAIYALPGEKEDNRLHTLPLFMEEMVITLSNDHELSKKPALYAKDISGLPYIERINCEFGDYGDRLFSEQDIMGMTVCKSARDDWVLGMVSKNFGYSFMPVSSAHYSGVVTRTLKDMPLNRTINFVTVRGRPHSPAVGGFVRLVKRHGWTSKGVSALFAE